MAINRQFDGQSISKPGAYSKSKVDNSGGAPLGSNDVLFLVGEAELGAPGDNEGIQEFSASQLDALVEKYGSGPIVDAALVSTRPSRTPGIGGAGRIQVWKTNSATQAQASINEATDTNPLLTLKDIAWGAPGNNISVTIADGTTSLQKLITINKLNETSEALGENAATAVLSIQYTGDGSTASLALTGVSQTNKTLATTLAGDQTDGSVNLAISLADYSMKELVDFINAQTGYSATLSDGTKAAKSGLELDPVAIADVKTSASSMYRLQIEIVELINAGSGRVVASLAATPVAGIPVNVTDEFLAGGAKGASTNQDFSDGFAQSLAKTWNVVLPCISRDASEDIADGLTDASSTYTIASVIAAEDSHLRLRGSTKNRKEAQGMAGFRDAQKADCFQAARDAGSFLVQLAMQDVLIVDASGSLAWKQPHVFAAMAAGIRLGTAVGEPLTHKFLNANGVGHVVDPETGLEGGDFNAGLDAEDAIDAGVMFSEEASGGNRIVVDNTTYGIDQSFVFNRGSVVEASQFIAKTLRETAELVFVGQKVSNGVAQSIKSVLRNKLRELNAPEVNITTASSDAPEGFVEETFVVEVEGNTARVQVEVKPVQGLDFVFITFTLGDITQSA